MNQDPGVVEPPAGELTGVGAALRETRERHGLTVSDAALALKLTNRQIEAMEHERFDLLPGAAFARGFMRNYARYLGLDPAPMIDALANTDGVGAPDLSPVSNAEGTMPTGDGGLRPSSLPVALIVVLLLAAVVGGWYFDWFQPPEDTSEARELMDTPVAPAPLTPVIPAPVEPAPVVIPDDAPDDSVPDSATGEAPGSADGVPETAADTPGTGVQPSTAGTGVQPSTPDSGRAAEGSGAAADATPTVAAPVTPRLVFSFSKESWVEVRDSSGEIIFSRVNRPGSVQEVLGTPPFQLVVGNSKDVKLEYNGKPVDLAQHTKVSVARLTLE